MTTHEDGWLSLNCSYDEELLISTRKKKKNYEKI